MRTIKSRGGLTRGRGMSESVRFLWTASMHHCASVHNAMSEITLTKHTSEQHAGMRITRRHRDYNDTNKVTLWFTEHNPFEGVSKLSCLHSRMTFNSDKAEEVGQKIQQP